jgi:hypothetical protein
MMDNVRNGHRLAKHLGVLHRSAPIRRRGTVDVEPERAVEFKVLPGFVRAAFSDSVPVLG